MARPKRPLSRAARKKALRAAMKEGNRRYGRVLKRLADSPSSGRETTRP